LFAGKDDAMGSYTEPCRFCDAALAKLQLYYLYGVLRFILSLFLEFSSVNKIALTNPRARDIGTFRFDLGLYTCMGYKIFVMKLAQNS
jgi:hypothetical protein